MLLSMCAYSMIEGFDEWPKVVAECPIRYACRRRDDECVEGRPYKAVQDICGGHGFKLMNVDDLPEGFVLLFDVFYGFKPFIR